MNHSSLRARTPVGAIAPGLAAFAVCVWMPFCDAKPPASTVPPWLEIRKGAHAYVGADGGNVMTLTVCATAKAYAEWLDDGVTRGRPCFAKPRGVPVVMVTDEIAATKLGSAFSVEYVVKIRAQDNSWSGWTIPTGGLQPRVPAGTIVFVAANDDLSVGLASESTGRLGASEPLPDGTALKVLAQDPASPVRDLHVLVQEPNGALPKKGWINSMVVTLASGDALMFQSPAQHP
jgi:hypothetical protein